MTGCCGILSGVPAEQRMSLHPKALKGDGTDARTIARLGRQRSFVEALRSGMSVKDAVVHVGIHHNTYHGWRSANPEFRAQCDVAKALSADQRPRNDRISFFEFRKKFFGFDTYPHQAQLVDALEHVKPREIVLVNIWPEAGKTTTVEDWVCYTLAHDPNRRITDVSQSQDLCIKSAERIKQRMTDAVNFGEFIGAYGPFHEEGQGRRAKPWARTHFTVDGASHNERDYSFQARAITSKVYGSRIDDLIIDDVQAWETLTQTKKVFEQLRRTYWNRGRSMRTIIIGTRLARGDVYETMMDAGIVDRMITIPAVQPDGTITCPELWGYDRADFETEEEFLALVRARIQKTREISGEDGWFASYQQIPSANELATFTDAMLDEAKDWGRVVGDFEAGDFTVLSLDPALGGGNALTAAVHGTETFKVLDVEISYKMASTDDILTNVGSFAARYHPQYLIVERDGQQKHFLGDNQAQELARKYGFQLIPHTTSRNKADPIFGVSSMASSFIKGEIRFPFGDDTSRQRLDPLLSQLRGWRGDLPTKMVVQDAVMSLWFNWRHWKMNQEARGAGSSMLDSWRRPGTPYSPTRYARAS